jgi:hypothetical protein
MMRWKQKFESRVNVMPQDKQEAQHKNAQDFLQFSRSELLRCSISGLILAFSFLQHLVRHWLENKSKCYLPTSFNQEYHLQVTNAWMQYWYEKAAWIPRLVNSPGLQCSSSIDDILVPSVCHLKIWKTTSWKKHCFYVLSLPNLDSKVASSLPKNSVLVNLCKEVR